jgi:hypothetical protein
LINRGIIGIWIDQFSSRKQAPGQGDIVFDYVSPQGGRIEGLRFLEVTSEVLSGI